MADNLSSELANPYTLERVKMLELTGNVNLSTLRIGSVTKDIATNMEGFNGFKISTNADLTKNALFVNLRMYVDLSEQLGTSDSGYKLVYLKGVLTGETDNVTDNTNNGTEVKNTYLRLRSSSGNLTAATIPQGGGTVQLQIETDFNIDDVKVTPVGEANGFSIIRSGQNISVTANANTRTEKRSVKIKASVEDVETPEVEPVEVKNVKFTVIDIINSVGIQLNDLFKYSCNITDANEYEFTIALPSGKFSAANIWYELDGAYKYEYSDAKPTTYVEVSKIVVDSNFGRNIIEKWLPVRNDNLPLGTIVMWSSKLEDMPWGWATCEAKPKFRRLNGELVTDNTQTTLNGVAIPNLTNYIPVATGEGSKLGLGEKSRDNYDDKTLYPQWNGKKLEVVLPADSIPFHYHKTMSCKEKIIIAGSEECLSNKVGKNGGKGEYQVEPAQWAIGKTNNFYDTYLSDPLGYKSSYVGDRVNHTDGAKRVLSTSGPYYKAGSSAGSEVAINPMVGDQTPSKVDITPPMIGIYFLIKFQ